MAHKPNYPSQTPSQSLFVKTVLLDHSPTHGPSFRCRLWPVVTEMVCDLKTKTIYFPALHRKKLLTPGQIISDGFCFLLGPSLLYFLIKFKKRMLLLL